MRPRYSHQHEYKRVFSPASYCIQLYFCLQLRRIFRTNAYNQIIKVYTTKSMQRGLVEIHQEKEEKKETWNCEVCSFENSTLLTMCEMCDSKRSDLLESYDEGRRSQKVEEGGFICHGCGDRRVKLEKKCGNCGQVLIPDDSEEEQLPPQPIKEELVPCPSCGFENHPDNELCISCETPMKPVYSRIPAVYRPGAKKRPIFSSAARKKTTSWMQACRYCSGVVMTSLLASHQAVCPSRGMARSIKDVIRTYCSFCYERITNSEVKDHDKTCQKRTQFFSPDNPTYDRLTPLQRNTINYMHNKCEDEHWMNEPALITRIQKLGYKSKDLENLHHYIVNYAPIIIHMHVNMHMQFFVKDTHYRNQFETRKSSGSLSSSARTNWQDRMFDGKHHSASPFERVKYGTINFTNDPKGVRACSGYGQSYFLLKDHVRNRCTVTDMDSSSSAARIGTFQFCYHVLNKLSDAELQAAFDGSKGKEVVSNMIGTYKEIQIHGPVEFKKDVQRVYVSKGELTDPSFEEMVKEFCENNQLEYQIFQYETIAAGGGGMFGAGSIFGGSLGAKGLMAPKPIFKKSVPKKTVPKKKPAPKKSAPKKTTKRKAPAKKSRARHEAVYMPDSEYDQDGYDSEI